LGPYFQLCVLGTRIVVDDGCILRAVVDIANGDVWLNRILFRYS